MIRQLKMTPLEYMKSRGQKPYRLTSSLAKTLTTQSPAHAQVELETPYDFATKRQDIGSILHALILGKGKDFAVATSFMTKSKNPEPSFTWATEAAKEFKELALASGKIPMFTHELKEYQAAAEIIKAKIERIVPLYLGGIEWEQGETEQAWEWTEDEILCRCQQDWRFEANVLDLKFWNSANPLALPMKIEDMGCDIQKAAYTHCAEAMSEDYQERSTFHLIVCEPEPPHSVVMVQIDPHMTAIGEQRWSKAKQIFRDLPADGPWPDYAEFAPIEATVWQMKKYEISVYDTPTEVGGEYREEEWNADSEWF